MEVRLFSSFQTSVGCIGAGAPCALNSGRPGGLMSDICAKNPKMRSCGLWVCGSSRAGRGGRDAGSMRSLPSMGARDSGLFPMDQVWAMMERQKILKWAQGNILEGHWCHNKEILGEGNSNNGGQGRAPNQLLQRGSRMEASPASWKGRWMLEEVGPRRFPRERVTCKQSQALLFQRLGDIRKPELWASVWDRQWSLLRYHFKIYEDREIWKESRIRSSNKELREGNYLEP